MKKWLISSVAALLAITLCACSGDGGSGNTSGGSAGSGATGVGTSDGGGNLPEATTQEAPDVTTEEKPTTTQTPDDPTKPPILLEDERMNKDKTYSVIFIGNSYTFFNDTVWKVFADIAADAGYSVKVDSVTGGGYYLDQHADPNDPCGLTLERKLKTKKYDYAFIQEQSTCPIAKYDRFEKGATALTEKLREKGIEVVFYETWGRKTGASDMIGTNQSMTEGLAEAYAKVGAKLRIPVSHAGLTFYEVYANHPEVEIYASDGSHPSPAGTYLAALCHFVTLSGENPLNLSYNGGVSEKDAQIIRQAVYDVVYSGLS